MGEKTTILISDKEVKVEGYTSDVSISDITDQEETRECRLRDEGGRYRCRRY